MTLLINLLMTFLMTFDDSLMFDMVILGYGHRIMYGRKPPSYCDWKNCRIRALVAPWVFWKYSWPNYVANQALSSWLFRQYEESQFNLIKLDIGADYLVMLTDLLNIFYSLWWKIVFGSFCKIVICCLYWSLLTLLWTCDVGFLFEKVFLLSVAIFLIATIASF